MVRNCEAVPEVHKPCIINPPNYLGKINLNRNKEWLSVLTYDDHLDTWKALNSPLATHYSDLSAKVTISCHDRCDYTQYISRLWDGLALIQDAHIPGADRQETQVIVSKNKLARSKIKIG